MCFKAILLAITVLIAIAIIRNPITPLRAEEVAQEKAEPVARIQYKFVEYYDLVNEKEIAAERQKHPEWKIDASWKAEVLLLEKALNKLGSEGWTFNGRYARDLMQLKTILLRREVK